MAGTTLGTAYVQIVPSAQGIKGSLTNLLGGEAEAAGKTTGSSLGANIVSFAKKAIIAGAIGKVIKASLDEGAKLQQSYFGGLDTLYGEAAEAARAYAREASKAGISMNSYSEQAVSFGAALKQAFGGDAKKAVEAANTAILDMADNSAKMGTDISSIQMAYQGFAKQNYTMLDNLKLGYGGTRSEMQRLLADAEALTGVHYDISNLGDVYEAIHVIQGELGLTGVAAAEASETFSGSFNAMKAAAQNFLGSLAIGENVSESLSTLMTSTATFFFGNFIPMLGTIISSLPGAIATFLQEGVPLLLSSISSLISTLAGQITSVANSLTAENVKAWASTTLPQIIASAAKIIGDFAKTLLANLPQIIAAVAKIGLEIVTGLGSAIWGKVKAAAEGVKNKFMEPINALSANVKEVIDKIASFITGLGPAVYGKVTEAANNIKTKFITPIENMRDKVRDILDKVKGFFPISIGNVISNLKLPHFSISGKFSINPPSVPHFSVSWYKQGGIFDSPTIAGIGEAGPEAVVPLDKFWESIENSNKETEALLMRQNEILLSMLEELSKEKNFKVDGIWAGRYINSMVR